MLTRILSILSILSSLSLILIWIYMVFFTKKRSIELSYEGLEEHIWYLEYSYYFRVILFVALLVFLLKEVLKTQTEPGLLRDLGDLLKRFVQSINFLYKSYDIFVKYCVHHLWFIDNILYPLCAKLYYMDRRKKFFIVEAVTIIPRYLIIIIFVAETYQGVLHYLFLFQPLILLSLLPRILFQFIKDCLEYLYEEEFKASRDIVEKRNIYLEDFEEPVNEDVAFLLESLEGNNEVKFAMYVVADCIELKQFLASINFPITFFYQLSYLLILHWLIMYALLLGINLPFLTWLIQFLVHLFAGPLGPL